ncbi:MAG: flagellin, partial [Tateyamaria sp.]|nr:flagellin [Tateyamaria sp.]
MSSILTNNSAMVALQTLQSINKNLATTQTEISTGKSVSSAKDDSAVWAISKVMESDVQGFKTISDSLSLGESTVAVAQNAAETVTDLLTQMKGKIVAAQEGNVDRGKLNTDVTALKDQINSVVSAAQFNGLNLVDGSAANATILSSLDRDSAGNVTSSSITVSAQDLSTSGYTVKAAFGAMTGVSATNDSFGFSLDASDGTTGSGTDLGTVIIDDPTYAAGDRINMSLGDVDVSYT